MARETIEIIVEGKDRASGIFGSIGSALGRIGEIAAGILSAHMLEALFDKAHDLMVQGIETSGAWDRMALSIQALTALQIKEGSAVEKLTNVGQLRLGLTIKEQKELDKLRESYIHLGTQIAIVTQRQVENTDKTKTSVKMGQNEQLRQYNDDLAIAAARIAELETKASTLVDITSITKEFGLTTKEAMAAAAPVAQELLGWLTELSLRAPFATDTIANFFRILVRSKVPVETAREMTEATLDFAAGMGLTNEELNSFAIAMGQTFAKGKLMAEEMNRQFTNAGLGIGYVADAMNIDIKVFQKKMTAGEISAKDFGDALLIAFQQDFDGMAAEMSSSFQAFFLTLSKIRDLGLRKLFGERDLATGKMGGILGGLEPAWKGLLATLTSTETQERIEKLGNTMGEWLGDTLEKARLLYRTFQQGGPTAGLLALGLPPDLAQRFGDLIFRVQLIMDRFRRGEWKGVWDGIVDLVKTSADAIWVTLQEEFPKITSVISEALDPETWKAAWGEGGLKGVIEKMFSLVGVDLDLSALRERLSTSWGEGGFIGVIEEMFSMVGVDIDLTEFSTDVMDKLAALWEHVQVATRFTNAGEEPVWRNGPLYTLFYKLGKEIPPIIIGGVTETVDKMWTDFVDLLTTTYENVSPKVEGWGKKVYADLLWGLLRSTDSMRRTAETMAIWATDPKNQDTLSDEAQQWAHDFIMGDGAFKDSLSQELKDIPGGPLVLGIIDNLNATIDLYWESFKSVGYHMGEGLAVGIMEALPEWFIHLFVEDSGISDAVDRKWQKYLRELQKDYDAGVIGDSPNPSPWEGEIEGRAQEQQQYSTNVPQIFNFYGPAEPALVMAAAQQGAGLGVMQAARRVGGRL